MQLPRTSAPPCLGLLGQTADRQTTNRPANQQSNNANSQQIINPTSNRSTCKPTNQQANKSVTNETKNRSKIEPKSTPNKLKINGKTSKNQENSSKIAPKISLGRCLRASGAAPGASWVTLGAYLAPRGSQNMSKTRFALPPWTSQVGPQNH